MKTHPSIFFLMPINHDLVAGSAVTGILHLVNQTPIESYCKKQATVATATYSSEYVTMSTVYTTCLPFLCIQ